MANVARQSVTTEEAWDRLRQLRIDRGWSIEEAARFAGIEPGCLDSYEQGMGLNIVMQLQNLAKLYRVSTDWMVTGEEAPLDVYRTWHRACRALIKLGRKVSLEEKRTLVCALEKLANLSDKERKKALRKLVQ